MVKSFVATLALALIAAPSGLVAQELRVGDRAPTVSVPDLQGKSVAIAVTPGRHAAVVEFWATWCEICRALLPEMRAAHQVYGKQVDFFGVDVTVNDGKAHVQRYVDKERPPFVPLYDAHGDAVRAFGAVATSHVVIIDSTGHVAYIGDGSDQKISAVLATLVPK